MSLIVIQTAEEAREKAAQVQLQQIYNKLTSIAESINQAVSEGEMSCYIDCYIDDEVKNKLETLGYKVTSGSQYNESYTNISWKL
jgi:hypothetical protein